MNTRRLRNAENNLQKLRLNESLERTERLALLLTVHQQVFNELEEELGFGKKKKQETVDNTTAATEEE